MKRVFRISSFVLALLLMCTAMAEISLPAGLNAIGDEAFLNNTSIQRVVVPDGAQQIGSRAFAGSSVQEVVLPESLGSIADDAFAGCSDDLLLVVYENSYAHRWGEEHDMLCQVLPASGGEAATEYCVHSVEYLDPIRDETLPQPVFRAVVSTIQVCTLQIHAMEENENMSYVTREVPLEAGLFMQQVEIPLDDILPPFYLLRAELLDENGNALGASYVNSLNTAAFVEVTEKTAEDYPAERVLNYGDAGFAVLAEDVILLGAQASSQDGSYCFASDVSLNTGDVVLLSIDGVDTPVKVGSVQDDGSGKLTITPDVDVALADFYDNLRINEDLDMVQDAEDTKYMSINQSLSFSHIPALNMLKLSAKGKLRGHVVCNYYKELSYFEFELTNGFNGTLGVTLSERIDTFKDDKSPRVDFVDTIVVIPYVNIPIPLRVSLPLNIKAEGGGTIDINVDNNMGFRFDTANGLRSICEGGITSVVPNLKGVFEFKIGPEVSSNIKIDGAVTIRAAIQAGGYGVAKFGGLLYETNEPRVEKIHACAECLDIDVGFFGGVRTTVKAKLNSNISYSVVDVGSDARWNTDVFHYSLRNEDISIFGGKETFGFGKCPNSKYLVDVFARNRLGEVNPDQQITVSGGKISNIYTANPGEIYLYPGDYNASTVFESGPEDRNFTVSNMSCSVLLQEASTSISGIVRDNYSKNTIAGAKVLLALPGGASLQQYTNDDGEFSFSGLAEGVYSVTVSMPGYQSRTIGDIICPEGTRHQVETYLVPVRLPVIRRKEESDGVATFEDALLTEDGEFPELYVTVAGDTDSYGYLEWVAIKHENCATKLRYEPRVKATPKGVEAFGVDMGNGEYTFALKVPNTGGGVYGGYEIFVFRENAGQWEVLEKLAYENFSRDIRTDAAFTDGNSYSGTIYPTGVSFSGTLPDDGEDRSGQKFFNVGLGDIDYELNEDGFYNLVFSTREFGLYKGDYLGSVKTCYTMQDGELVIKNQWFVPGG